MPTPHLLLVTCPDTALADSIARILVEEGLAACGNVLPGLRSIYRWQGTVETAEEVLLLVKTGTPQAAMERMTSLHPYTLPCIIHAPITDGLPAYLDWVANNGG